MSYDFPPEPLPPSVVQRDRLEAKLSELTEHAGSNLASAFFGRLARWISDFDKELDDKFEVGVRLVSFGEKVTFHLDDMSYWDY